MENRIILIISQRFDVSTVYVIDWLLLAKTKFIRIDDFSEISINKLLIDNTGYVNGEIGFKNIGFKKFTSIQFENIMSLWYRRGDLKHSFIKFKQLKNINFLDAEWKRIKKVLYNISVKKLGNFYFETEVNKFEMLRYAKLAGFSIPQSFISESIDFIKEKLQKYGTLVVKALRHKTINLTNNDTFLSGKVQILTRSNIKK